jgi:hypothetical protein
LTGFLINSGDILNKLQKKRYALFIFIFLDFILINNYKIFINNSKMIKSVIIDIVIVCIFISFGLIPFEAVKSQIIKRIIKQLTRYTGGIYYTHIIVKIIFSKYFKIIHLGDFNSCIIIYYSPKFYN